MEKWYLKEEDIERGVSIIYTNCKNRSEQPKVKNWGSLFSSWKTLQLWNEQNKNYNIAEEKKRILVQENSLIDLITQSTYLDSIITSDLHDKANMSQRIEKASKTMGTLNFIWNTTTLVNLYSKILLYRCIQLNLLLWGCFNGQTIRRTHYH